MFPKGELKVECHLPSIRDACGGGKHKASHATMQSSCVNPQGRSWRGSNGKQAEFKVTGAVALHWPALMAKQP